MTCLICGREDAEVVRAHLTTSRPTVLPMCAMDRKRWRDNYGIQTTAVLPQDGATHGHALAPSYGRAANPAI